MNKQKRARDPKAKEARRFAILEVASKLFADAPQQLPTISAIALKTGLAKGTIYLYFKSKEEIFLALLEDHYLAWLSMMEKSLSGGAIAADEMIERVCGYIDDNPEFLRLAVISNAIIENNIERSVLMAYKNHIAAQFKKSATMLAEKSEQPVADCGQLLMRSYALLVGLWQLAHPPEKISQALNNPTLKVLKPDFKLEARMSLAQLWQGFFVTRQQEKKGVWSNIFG